MTGALTIPAGQLIAESHDRVVRLQDGRALSTREWTGRTGKTLVFLHGMLHSSEGWTGWSEQLGGRRIALDLPGFGRSDPPRRGSLDGYARDVADGLDALRVENFTLVGHSLGGGVAAALSELIPDRIEALVLLAPTGFGHIRLAEALSAPIARIVFQTALPIMLSSGLAVTAAYMTMVSNGKLPEPGFVERVTGHGRGLVAGVREATRALVDSGRSPDGFRRHLSYRGPVYGVWGDRDRLVPTAHSRGLRTAFPQAQVEIWRGMGHHPARERLDDLIALIRRATPQPR